MKVLIVNHNEVRQLLPMADCMTAMADVLKLLSDGDALNPLRSVVWLPDKTGLMAMMPASLAAPPVMGLKAISVFPGNSAGEYDAHQGAVMLFETRNGRLLALIDATEVTAIRTAAVSAVATGLLARKDAGELAILGAGTQARKHLEAMLAVRKIRRVLPIEAAARIERYQRTIWRGLSVLFPGAGRFSDIDPPGAIPTGAVDVIDAKSGSHLD